MLSFQVLGVKALACGTDVAAKDAKSTDAVNNSTAILLDINFVHDVAYKRIMMELMRIKIV
jgi:hypothetical protein